MIQIRFLTKLLMKKQLTMKNNLLAIDSVFTKQYRDLLGIQQDIWLRLKDYDFNLKSNEITVAIAERMDAFWFFNVHNNKQILERKTNTTAADFFTETCLFFIKAYFENKHNVSVKSEMSIVPGRNAIRPDISIWKGNDLIAAIELKVSDGWKGKNIIPHLIERENIIRSICPNAYFGVIAFWDFFDTNTPEWNKKYVSIKHFNEKENHPFTGGRIESILLEIEKKITEPYK